jgi:alpha-ketoglutarate-dependent taurine dioxygenase
MKLKQTCLTEDFGTLVEPEDGKAEVDLSPELQQEIVELMKRRGVVHFRGFNFDVAEFERFTNQFGTSEGGFHPRFSGDSRFVGTAPQGYDFEPLREVGAHSELAYTPWPPDLIWFYCIHPADSGGRTTVFDGIKFLNELDPDTRDLFFVKKLLFRQSFTSDRWQMLFGETQQDVRAALEPYGIVVEFEDSELIARYAVSAIKKTKFGDHYAFVNTIVRATQDERFYGMTFEDGTLIPDEVKQSVCEIAKRLQIALPWQTADFSLVDNTRAMHGREAYTDPSRAIKARHAMARFM